MIDILYCDKDTIMKTLAESLVIGGLPMRTDKLTKENLFLEVTSLRSFLEDTWGINDCIEKVEIKKDDEKTIKTIRIKSDLVDNEETSSKLYSFLLGREICSSNSYTDKIDESEENGMPEKELFELRKQLTNKALSEYDKYISRGMTLGHVPTGSGHNSMFKGVNFNMIIRFPLYWLKEYQRYHFTDIISSQSTMHKILKFNLDEMFSDEVDPRCIEVMHDLRKQYEEETDSAKKKAIWRKIINSCPDGLNMVQGITMNYLQAASIVEQRKSHPLSEWKEDFVPYLKELPFFELFLGSK